MAAPEPATVEVAYALRDVQRVVTVAFNEGMTALQAIERTPLIREFPELSGRTLDLGIHGRVVQASQLLRPGDRVEIYRPLTADPRQTRRRLAASGRTMEKSGRSQRT
jgi:uncharacterized protein